MRGLRFSVMVLYFSTTLNYRTRNSIEGRKMLRRNPRYKLQVPHGLAVLGTLLVLAGTATGVGGTLQSQPSQSALVAAGQVASGEADAAGRTSEQVESMPQAQLRKNNRFKVNLFLFRR